MPETEHHPNIKLDIDKDEIDDRLDDLDRVLRKLEDKARRQRLVNTLASLVIALLASIVVMLFGGPTWANLMTFLLVYFSVNR